MKKIAILFAAAVMSVSAALAGPTKWRLAWEDNFNSNRLDTSVWGRCTRGTSNWDNTMSDREDLVIVRDGKLILRGIVNPDTSVDHSPYLTGGVWTKNRKSFAPGKIEIRARLHGAKGAWPALWLLPYDYRKYRWPLGGEIDIMERLNNNHFVYQTVHSDYTQNRGGDKNPPHSTTGAIDRDGFNVYGVEIHPDRIVFLVNGKETMTYPATGVDGQFPFYIDQYLLMDMQLGGDWVGDVDAGDLPVEMEIDWVRHYLPE